MSSLARLCPNCKKYQEIFVNASEEFSCPDCRQVWGKMGSLETIFECCPVCQCRQFYTGKDFNQFWGCLMMLPGIILTPWTYGLSLPFFAFLDWLMYRRVKTMVNCYKCGTEFRGLSMPQHLKPFIHHIGLKYDKYR